jgi:hypothetical protein
MKRYNFEAGPSKTNTTGGEVAAPDSREKKTVENSNNMRDSECSNEGGYMSDRSPRTINSNSLDNNDPAENEATTGAECDSPCHLLADGPVLLTMPIKDMHDRTRLNMRTLVDSGEFI